MISPPASSDRTQLVRSLADLSGRYDAVLCDLWGCYHNGIEPFAAAVSALRQFRANGGVVFLLTNAPRPSASVKQQLDSMQAPQDSYDGIISSGDAARKSLETGAWGRKYLHIGPERDFPLFANLDLEHTSLAQAEFILCSGLYDDNSETPDTYASLLSQARQHALPMLCANPDILVDRGDKRLYCAGALAAAYEKIGGDVTYYGKPHAPIYEYARSELDTLRGTESSPSRILAIGDGIHTDIKGARAQKIDSLLVTGGLALPEIGGDPTAPSPESVQAYIDCYRQKPTYYIGRLQ